MSDETNFKTAVELALAKRGMTLGDLSDKMGTHKSMLSRLINEEQPFSLAPLLPRLLKALDIEVIITYRLK